MEGFRTILVPVDRSDHSRSALPHAAEFAKAYGASLKILHVAEVPPVLPIPEDGALQREAWLRTDELVGAARTGLEKLVEETAALSGLSPEIVVRSGLPAEEILLESEESDTDLIVLATHGRSGLSRFLLGSVAEKIILEAPCPVLSLRPSGIPRPGSKGGSNLAARPERILVPTDLGDHSFSALPVAIDLAERFDGEVALVAILEDPLAHPEIDWEERAGVTPEEVKARNAEAIREQLRARIAGLAGAERVHRVEVQFGHPASTLVDRAEAEGFDLVVIASHGRGGLARMVLGSVAREVARHAPCPVLTLRPGDA